MAKKHQSPIRNCSEYNQALVNRGSLTLWLSPDVLQDGYQTEQVTGDGDDDTHNHQAALNRQGTPCFVPRHNLIPPMKLGDTPITPSVNSDIIDEV